MKQSWYDDRGLIDSTAEGLRFAGEKVVLRMERISAVHLTGPVIPWVALTSLLIGNVLVLLMAKAGVFNYMTLENPVTYVALGLLDLFALVSWPMHWVKVEYLDERDQPCRAYFTAGSLLGRWTGGTGRLHALMQQAGQRA
jgi:hypothetical protein